MTQLIHQRFHDNLTKATHDFTSQANKHVSPVQLKPGMLVMTRDFSARGDTPKLDPKFIGPYRVQCLIRGNKYRIKHLYSGAVSEVHGDHLKPLSYDSPDSHSPDQDNSLSTLPTQPLPSPGFESVTPVSQDVTVDSGPVSRNTPTHNYSLRPRLN